MWRPFEQWIESSWGAAIIAHSESRSKILIFKLPALDPLQANIETSSELRLILAAQRRAIVLGRVEIALNSAFAEKIRGGARMKMAAARPPVFAFSLGFHKTFETLLLWLLLLTVQADAQNGSGEVATLMSFKDMVGVDIWVMATGYFNTWKETDNNPCLWYGVTCTETSTVQALKLSNWKLTKLTSLGVLSNLTDLRELDLSQNNFVDPYGGNETRIPDDVGSLVGLTLLDLSNSFFSGPLPHTISACRNLRFLSVVGNQLTGEIPDLSGLTNLQYLHCAGNRLSGPFPKWLGELPSLLEVDLSVNMLNGTIPSISNLTSLLDLMLENNSFTSIDGAMFPDARNLERFSVLGNQLEGPIPLNVTKLVNLKILNMAANRLTGDIPSGFSLNMSEAIWVDLSSNQLTGSIPESLLRPTPTLQRVNLPGLVLSHNRLSGPVPFDRSKTYNYYKLDFNNNSLSGSLPPICSNGSSYIARLWFQNNNLSGDIVDFLAQCYASGTSEMRLGNNSFTGDLSRMTNVNTSIDFDRRERTPTVLDLSNNQLRMSTTTANPDPLRAILEFFANDTFFTEFYIDGNDFSGTRLPADLRKAANSLKILDLSRNNLMGEISAAAFNSTWFPTLELLNLSSNDASGRIPEALVMLPNLTVLSVTNNSLSGPLPTSLPERLYNRNSFAGNDGLCGGPLRSCSEGTGVQWWVLLIAIAGSVIIAVGSCLVLTWRLRVYRKVHQQDADLIRTLLERESTALMTLRELKKATDNFAESAQVGAGGFGTVYAGKLNDGTMVAIKRSRREGSEEDKNQFLNEVRILSHVSHRHLVKLLGCCLEHKTALLVFEYVSNGTLQEHLQGKIGDVPLSWKQRLRIAVQTADALNYLHCAASFPIYHRDVKSANILLDEDLNAKVADFGISKLAPLESTHVSTIAIQGTIGYMDPEYYTSYQLTDRSDVYSFGVVLLELISAKPAVDSLRGGEEVSLVNFALLHLKSGDLQKFIDGALMESYEDSAGHIRESILNVGSLAVKCLQMRSKTRPSMYEVSQELQNVWLELEGKCKELPRSANDDGNNDPGSDHTTLLPDSYSRSDRFIEMSDMIA